MFSLLKKKEIVDYDFCLNLPKNKYPKYLMEIFEEKMGYKFNINKPKTINEIIQYLKLYDNLPIKKVLTDKTKVNAYVEAILGTKKYTKQVFGIYDSLNDVNFNNIPDKFIIKLNNASKVNVPIFNKQIFLDKYYSEVNFFLNSRLNINYAFVSGFELQYDNIPPKIIIERLYPKVQEYQVLCSDGRPIFVHFLDAKQHIYNELIELDENSKLLQNLEASEKIEEIIEAAKVLSKGFKLVRVDFMLVNKQYIFFQELTFTPYSGFADSSVPEFNSEKYGKLINYR